MNMTPLIDVTFQLIIFFMLVSNLISEQDVPMIVPDLTRPRTQALGEVPRIIVNVVPMPFDLAERAGDDPLQFSGEAAGVQIGPRVVSMDRLDAVVDAVAEARQHRPEARVLLRADAALYYEQVRPVLEALAAADIRRVSLVAKMPRKPAPPAEGGS